MFSELHQPGYLHVVINHLPIIGAGIGALAMLVALLLRQRAALVTALIVVLFAGVSAWPVYETGEDAYRPIRKIADDTGQDLLDEHQERADRTVWAFYVMAGLAVATLAAPLRWPRTSLPLAIATTIAALACLGVGAYIAQPGGRIRHVEFRPGHARVGRGSQARFGRGKLGISGMRTGQRPAAPAIPRTVWVLGFVSLFMDMFSELVHGLSQCFSFPRWEPAC